MGSSIRSSSLFPLALAFALGLLFPLSFAQFPVQDGDNTTLASLCAEIVGVPSQGFDWTKPSSNINQVTNTSSQCAPYCNSLLLVCVRDGRTVGIRNKNQDFIYLGTLPDYIGNLSLLEKLDISGVGFSGTIPASISFLNLMNFLNLGSNRFSGEIPDMPQSLVTISISNNSLEGDIPDSLSTSNVSTVQASNNALIGAIPCNDENCWPRITKMTLSSNMLITDIPLVFGSRALLDTLQFENNSFVVGCVSGSYSWLTNDQNCAFPALSNRDMCACGVQSNLVTHCVTGDQCSTPTEWRSFKVFNANTTQVLPGATFKIFLRAGGSEYNVSWLLLFPSTVVPLTIDIMGPVPRVDINFFPYQTVNYTLIPRISDSGTIKQYSSRRIYWAGSFKYPFADNRTYELCGNLAYALILTTDPKVTYRVNLNVSCSWFPQCPTGRYRSEPWSAGCLDLNECTELTSAECPNCINTEDSFACLASTLSPSMRSYWQSMSKIVGTKAHLVDFLELLNDDVASYELESSGSFLMTVADPNRIAVEKIKSKFNSRLPSAPDFEFDAQLDGNSVTIKSKSPSWIIIVSVVVPILVVLPLLLGGLGYFIYRLRQAALPDPWYFTYDKNWSPMDKGVFTRLIKDHEQIHDLDMMIKFQSMWDKMNGRQFEVVSVTAIYNESLKTAFKIFCDNRIRRMKANPALFSSRDWERTDPDKHRKWLSDRFGEFVDRFSWNHGIMTDLKSPVIPAVQVTTPSIAVSIARRGFAHGGGLIQQGDYGAGFYFSTFPEYVAFADSNDPIETTLLLCLVSPGNPYPVIEEPQTISRASVNAGGDSVAKIKTLKGIKVQHPKYQSHFAGVSGGLQTGKPYQHDGSDCWDEVVVDQDSQILPAFLVTVQKTSLSQPDITFNDAKFLSYQSTFDDRPATSDDLRGLLLPGFATSSSPLLDANNTDFELPSLRSKQHPTIFANSNDVL